MAGLLPGGLTLAGMDISFHGEVWTDARGQAIVSLPQDAFAPLAELEYALHTIDGDSGVRVLSELRKGHFTIATEQPHVKVAWRISRRTEKSP